MCFLYFFLPIEASDLLQKLSLDSQTKSLEISEHTKKVCSHIELVLILAIVHFFGTVFNLYDGWKLICLCLIEFVHTALS